MPFHVRFVCTNVRSALAHIPQQSLKTYFGNLIYPETTAALLGFCWWYLFNAWSFLRCGLTLCFEFTSPKIGMQVYLRRHFVFVKY